MRSRVTIRAGVADEDNGPVDRLKAQRDAEPARCAQKDYVHEIVDHWVCELSDKQRAVVERRFGLHGYRRSTLEQIGDEIGVTRERVRQIRDRAILRLRSSPEGAMLSEYTN